MAEVDPHKTVTLTELRARAGELVENVMKTKRPLRISQRNRPAAVLLDVEQYERLNYEREFFAAISEGRTAVAEGRVRPHKDVMEETRQWLQRRTK